MIKKYFINKKGNSLSGYASVFNLFNTNYILIENCNFTNNYAIYGDKGVLFLDQSDTVFVIF